MKFFIITVIAIPIILFSLVVFCFLTQPQPLMHEEELYGIKNREIRVTIDRR